MSHLINEFADSASSLRSAVLVCLALMTTAVVHQQPLAKPRSAALSARGASSSLVRLEDINQGTSSLPIGSHLISPRKLYAHHGIYLGNGEVAHYSGFCTSFKAGPVEVTDLEYFANGNDIWIAQEQCRYSNNEIVSRARSRVGERQYSLFSNNCEHFCNWCISGESYSAQINACLHFSRHAFSWISGSQPSFMA
ncbi:lecithin retinol acyltransferase family protein [Pseudomonas taiwanensis]|uniref:lecithin retinol acyltransferase family protein n=1 Tax=Pseudomonas taiwanensis TaxID=470150 RepID=UPI00356B6E68